MPIDQKSPQLERVVPTGQDIEQLGGGFNPAEGPIWWHEGGYLLFSDIRHNRRMRWDERNGVTLFREPTNNANGLTRDTKGRLIACERALRRITRLEPDGEVTVMASSYRGVRLNRPNDVIVKSDGGIYFTDPGGPDPELDLDFCGVYRISPTGETVTLVARDFVFPNGLAFSPDESILYIVDSGKMHIRAFDMRPYGNLVLPVGMLALGTDRVFFEFPIERTRAPAGEYTGVPDGIKVDTEGNVYCAAFRGVWIFDPSGQHLGTISTGAETATNCAWGGADWKTLFITTRHMLYRIRLKIAGVPVPQLLAASK